MGVLERIARKKKAGEPCKENYISQIRIGWLSPSGVFTRCDFGGHEQAAWDIIKQNGFAQDFMGKDGNGGGMTFGDYLVGAKGYALLNDPGLHGAPYLTYRDSLSTEQADFLFRYYTDMGFSGMEAGRKIREGRIVAAAWG